MKAIVTSRGRITIPLAIRRKLHLEAGDILDFDKNTPFLKATKHIDRSRMDSVLGLGKKRLQGKTSREWLDDLRGPVDLP